MRVAVGTCLLVDLGMFNCRFELFPRIKDTHYNERTFEELAE